MADSKRKLALADLVSALQTISVANGYATNVAEVAMRAFEWETVWQDHTLPVIGVVPGEVVYDYRAQNGPLNGVIVATQTVVLEFAYQTPTQAEAWDDGDALVDDIIGAIHVDPTRGGNALHTMIKSAETEAGNPDVMDSRGGTSMGIIRLEILLARGWKVTP